MASETQLEPPEGRRVSPWIKVFVVFHIAAITIWALPSPPSGILDGKQRGALGDRLLVFNQLHLKPSPVKYYLMPTGFWQYWDMFSPNPASIDFYGTAEVVFRDGTVRPYQYPRMFLLPLHTKYLKERYRKFYERAHLEANSYLWPTFAQRVALLHFEDPENPPVTVRLTRHWLQVSPPGEPQPTEYREHMYYSHEVDLEQLREAVRRS
jgi:hypothetical protein